MDTQEIERLLREVVSRLNDLVKEVQQIKTELGFYGFTFASNIRDKLSDIDNSVRSKK